MLEQMISKPTLAAGLRTAKRRIAALEMMASLLVGEMGPRQWPYSHPCAL